MASIVKRNKSYAVVYTDTTGERKRQKWETYYSLTEAEQRKELLELCASARTEARVCYISTSNCMVYPDGHHPPTKLIAVLGIVRNRA